MDSPWTHGQGFAPSPDQLVGRSLTNLWSDCTGRRVLRAIFSIPRGPRVSAGCGLTEAPSPAINGRRDPPFFILSDRRAVCHFVAVSRDKRATAMDPPRTNRVYTVDGVSTAGL